ncbi:MAG TPA: protein kinase [Pyrinomonadaceae bacterium]|jgi:serine/threonine-protein kinase
MKRCQTCNTIGGDNQATCYLDGQPLVEDPLATTLQEAIGAKYSLTQLIGKGAMGAVYRAHHRDLGDVAIKVMLGRGDNQALSERFLREARALRRLRHQNAVLIYDLDRSLNGVTYMVMEMVAGSSLRADLRERKRFTLDETMEVAEAVCSALTAAHERGIIHRDLKPDNILRAEEKGLDEHVIRTIKIADFGIVKQRTTGDNDEELIQLTKFGKPIGTPFYMSPEQWFGDSPGLASLDHRTDIYALGCTLYELLSGRPPFLGRTTAEMRRQHLHDEPPPLHELAPQVPLPFSRVIMRSLAKDRDERQQSATEFIEDLRAAYDKSFERTGEKIDAMLPTTQEPSTDEGAVAARPPDSLSDTEEEVPMFAEKIVALVPAPAEQEQDASVAPPVSAVAAEANAVAAPQEPSTSAFASEQTPAYGSMPERDARPLAYHSLPASVAAASQPGRRRALVVSISLLLFGTALIVALGIYLYRNRSTPVASENVAQQPPPPLKPPQIPMSALTGTLRVRATPGSEVFVDDEKAGVTGQDGLFSMQVPVGLRNVRIAAKNYRLWSRDARIRANQKTTLTAGREPPLEVRSTLVDERQQRAREAYDKKSYGEAEAEYRELLKTDADNAPAHTRLGQILNQQQRYTEAITEFEAAARLDAKSIEARQPLVRLYLLKGRDAEAEATARQLVKLAPRDASARQWLARALLRDPSKLDEALGEIEAALKIKESAELLETKAYILLARNSFDEALATARNAAELDRGKNTTARASLAVILFRVERVDEALAIYRELRQADKSDLWGDIKRLELRGVYSRPVLETLAALIARTN